MVINVSINKAFNIHDLVRNYSNVFSKRNQYFQCFNIQMRTDETLVDKKRKDVYR